MEITASELVVLLSLAAGAKAERAAAPGSADAEAHAMWVTASRERDELAARLNAIPLVVMEVDGTGMETVPHRFTNGIAGVRLGLGELRPDTVFLHVRPDTTADAT